MRDSLRWKYLGAKRKNSYGVGVDRNRCYNPVGDDDTTLEEKRSFAEFRAACEIRESCPGGDSQKPVSDRALSRAVHFVEQQ